MSRWSLGFLTMDLPHRLHRIDEELEEDENSRPTPLEEVVSSAAEHLAADTVEAAHRVPIPRDLIDLDALKIIHRLTRYGHVAYLVGGCVRDLLLGHRPKDFDVATSAWPGEIRDLFRNCRIIGRRFRLAHILFSGKFIEVSTFRGNAAEAVESSDGEDLLIREDNVFGSPEEDARRRDFTINALFYDAERQEIIDYIGGLDDVERRLVRSIGDPQIRFREDPVRILRALRFSARLGFACEHDIHQAIADVKDDLVKSAPPRVHEELLKTLASGAAARAFRMLYETGVLGVLMPSVSDSIPDVADTLSPLLDALDGFDQGRRSVSDAVLLAAYFYPLFRHQVPEGHDPDMWLEDLRSQSVILQSTKRRDVEKISQIFRAQRRFVRDGRARHFSVGAFMRKDYFQDAWLLFRLASQALDEHRDLVESWLDRLGGRAGSPHQQHHGRPPGQTPAAADGVVSRSNSRRRRRRRGRSRGEDDPIPA